MPLIKQSQHISFFVQQLYRGKHFLGLFQCTLQNASVFLFHTHLKRISLFVFLVIFFLVGLVNFCHLSLFPLFSFFYEL